MMHDGLDIAWAAGLYEGEGSIYVDRTDQRKGRGRPVLQMGLATTDHDVILKFAGVAGGTVYGPYWMKRSTKPVWRWALRIDAEVRALAEQFWPFLGERRRGQITRALEVKDEAERQYRPRRPGPRNIPRLIAGQGTLKW